MRGLVIGGTSGAASEGAPRHGPGELGSGSGFRQDIAGLRGVAVAAVVLYHARLLGTSGGYVGVDAFFVLSGFLITSLLVAERRDSGRIDLWAFYGRRVRRLLPMSLVAFVATVVAVVALESPLRRVELLTQARAVALYVSNLVFAKDGLDYLRAGDGPSPFQHYWSLANEEQFYVVWPVAIGIAASIRRGRGRLERRVGALIWTMIVGSFAVSMWWTSARRPWAFFLLPARAWELGVGAAVALIAGRRGKIPGRVVAASGWAGLGLIAAAVWGFDDLTRFPAPAAAIPVVGTAMVIWSGSSAPLASSARSLSIAPLRWMGTYSYSIYLWHWPLLTVPVASASLRWEARVALVAAALGLSVVSYHLVEHPLRHHRLLVARPGVTITIGAFATIASVALVVGLARLTPLDAGRPSRSTSIDHVSSYVPSDLRPALSDAADSAPLVYNDGCHLDYLSTELGSCVYGQASATRTMVLFGDSHAAQWFPALDDYGRRHGWRLVSWTKSACPSSDLVLRNEALGRRYAECSVWRDAVFARLEELDPEVVVLANYDRVWIDQLGEDRYLAGLGDTLDRLPDTATPVVMGDTPEAGENVPACLSSHIDDVRPCAPSASSAGVDRRRSAVRRTVEGHRGVFIDPTSWICPGRTCPPVRGNLLVFRDDNHLAPAFVRGLADTVGAAVTAGLPADAGS